MSFDGPANAIPTPPLRRLVLVLGDQLWLDNPALVGLDRQRDAVLMIESDGEARAVWNHKARIALFLSAMRHFAVALRARGWPVLYERLAFDSPPLKFQEQLARRLRALRPQTLEYCEPGDWAMAQDLQNTAQALGVRAVVHPDPHFLCSIGQFAQWARGRRELRMEFFYRDMRRRHRVLLEPDGQPTGGHWNFDADNRAGYPRSGPGPIPEPTRFAPDAITLEVFDLIQRRYTGHPGRLERFAWPVTRAQALVALQDFAQHRLPGFGRHQDAMWTTAPLGWHSLLSAALNLHLLDPREVVAAAAEAWRAGRVPLADAEGFIRQILGWREFIRGVYWLDMPALAHANFFGHDRPLPDWYWTGDTQMACMRAVIGQTLDLGYAHHIQRLMVTGQFALLAGIAPPAVCDWYLAVYVDAVDWVERPNTTGMALYANGGRFTSKPYIASGQYIRRMSNYCDGCRYRPQARSGDDACPVTVLFWNFLIRHERWLVRQPRTAPMARHVTRLSHAERLDTGEQAQRLLDNLDRL